VDLRGLFPGPGRRERGGGSDKQCQAGIGNEQGVGREKKKDLLGSSNSGKSAYRKKKREKLSQDNQNTLGNESEWEAFEGGGRRRNGNLLDALRLKGGKNSYPHEGPLSQTMKSLFSGRSTGRMKRVHRENEATRNMVLLMGEGVRWGSALQEGKCVK